MNNDKLIYEDSRTRYRKKEMNEQNIKNLYNWIPVGERRPTRTGNVVCKCGKTGEVFTATWEDDLKIFSDGIDILEFGNRAYTQDMWAEKKPIRMEARQ